MTKLDGQVWISLYNLLLKEDCQRKYDFNSFNKSQLLKVYCVRNVDSVISFHQSFIFGVELLMCSLILNHTSQLFLLILLLLLLYIFCKLKIRKW